jgi:radical SAM superfamily enzyme YgiQ (UPF0313 family)
VRVVLLCPPAALEPPLVRPRHAPLFTLALATALREAGHDPIVEDAHRTAGTVPAILDHCFRHQPGAVFVLHSDYNRRTASSVMNRIVEAITRRAPSLPVVGYGRLYEASARKAMERAESLPAILWGEPEDDVDAVASALAAGESLAGVPGTIVRTAAGLQSTAPSATDPGRWRLPAWDLLPVHLYPFSPHQQEEDPVYPVLASRGCPYPCFYCEVRAQPRYAVRPVEQVVDEMVALQERFGARSYFLADPTFAVDRRWGLEFCRAVRASSLRSPRWSCMSRTDRVDPELLRAMAEAGCWNILFGIESFGGAALEGATKNLDPKSIEPAIRAAQGAGIEVIASIMIGLPGDSPRGFEHTLKELIRIEPDYAQFFVVSVEADAAPEGGRYVSEVEGGRYEFWGRLYAPDAFEGKEQLLRLRREAFRRFYLRPGYIVRQLRRMARRGDLKGEVRRAAMGGILALRLAGGEQLS